MKQYKFRFYVGFGLFDGTSYTLRADNEQEAIDNFKKRYPGLHKAWCREGSRTLVRPNNRRYDTHQKKFITLPIWNSEKRIYVAACGSCKQALSECECMSLNMQNPR